MINHKTDSISVRRILVTISWIVAVIMGPVCLLWSGSIDSGDDDAFLGDKNFIIVTSFALLAGLIVFVAGRGKWRWLLVIILAPLVYNYYHEVRLELTLMRLHSYLQPPYKNVHKSNTENTNGYGN